MSVSAVSCVVECSCKTEPRQPEWHASATEFIHGVLSQEWQNDAASCLRAMHIRACTLFG